MRLEPTHEGLLVQLVNHYTTPGTQQAFIEVMRLSVYCSPQMQIKSISFRIFSLGGSTLINMLLLPLESLQLTLHLVVLP